MPPKETPAGDQRRTVRADTLDQVEPENAAAFWVRPYSLTDAELGGLPAVLASAPTPVRAWVKYPATAEQVHGLALAWTPRAVYVEWEGEGTHPGPGCGPQPSSERQRARPPLVPLPCALSRTG
jgi:hypothetical protein